MKYHGDIKVGRTIRGVFNTRDTDGVPITLAGTPAIHIYKDDGTTEDDSGITLNIDFDGRTGLHLWEIDTSADGVFYTAGSDFSIIITTGTVDGVSVVGVCVGEFSIENRCINWGQVVQPSTAVNLSATNIDVDQVIASVSGAVGSVTGAVGSVTGNVGGNVSGTVASVVGAVGSVTGNVGGNVTGSVGSIAGTTFESIHLDHMFASADPGGVVADSSFWAKLHSKSATPSYTSFNNTTDSLEAVRDRGDAAWITATGFSTHSAADVWAVPTRVLTAATNISGPIADQVWEEAIADHSGTVGSTAEALNAAGSAGDPWTTSLPGSYTGTQAGKILADVLADTNELQTDWTNGGRLDLLLDDILADTGTDIPALISGLAIPTADDNANAVWDEAVFGHTTVGSFGLTMTTAATNVAAVKSKTDNLPAAPAAVSDCITAAGVRTAVGMASANLDTQLSTITDDTNELQTDWANGGRLDLILDARASQISVDDIPTNAELATALSSADDAVLARLGTPAGASVSADIATKPTLAQILAGGDIDGFSLEAFCKLALAALAGRSTGGGTSEIIYRAADNSKARITATVDGSNNRVSLVLDATG